MDDSLAPAELEAWHAVLTVADIVRFRVAAEIRPATGLSSADHVVLMQLKEAPGNQIPQYALADKMLWAKARLSRHLSRMQERGLVERVRDRTTSGVLITLTEKGRDAVEAAAAPHAAAVFELVRLQAQDVHAGPVWEGSGSVEIFRTPSETLSALPPARVGRGWRYSIAMTNSHNHLLRDLRSPEHAETDQAQDGLAHRLS